MRKIATVAACALACAAARADGTDQAKTPSTDAKPAGAHTADAHAAPRTIDLEKAREWWSYRPIADAPPPAVRDAAWVRNDIDRFILARLEADGLVPAPEADRVALIRRATYDLTGLPPTPAEVDAFLDDHDPHAWERVVDRLLASQHYGERWGRHWLDLVRYADTNGFERDGDKPGTWRYRDWVIGAMNQDKPYDRFITEQLAGDELPDRDFSTMVATGYYRLGMWDDEVPDLKQALADDMDGIVDITARTMLGVGLGCARCHDHKGDPIPQRDYYAFSAFFAGVRPYKSYAGNSIEARNVTRSIDPDVGRRDLEAERIAFRERRSALVESLLAIESAAGLLPPANGSSGTAPDRAPTDGLVAHYAFETEATAPEADRAVVRSTVPGPTAKVKDLRWGERGRFGLGGTFDGGDDRVLLDRPVADDFTISAWFRTDRVAAGDDSDPRWFLGSGIVDGEVPGIVDDFGISMIGNGIVAAGIGHPETFLNSSPGHNDGQWHHVALTRERASGTVVLYLDGVEVDRGTGSTRRLDSPRNSRSAACCPVAGRSAGRSTKCGSTSACSCLKRCSRRRPALVLHRRGIRWRPPAATTMRSTGRPPALNSWRCALRQPAARWCCRCPRSDLSQHQFMCSRVAARTHQPSAWSLPCRPCSPPSPIRLLQWRMANRPAAAPRSPRGSPIRAIASRRASPRIGSGSITSAWASCRAATTSAGSATSPRIRNSSTGLLGA